MSNVTQRAFRFGVIAEQMTTAHTWRLLAQRTEALGYATLLIRDHFIAEGFGHQFAPFSALMAAAAATSQLRVGTMVIGNDYRHPVMLAKEAATLDLLSDGRFELGLGAGWMRNEYEQAGMAYDPPGVRVARLAEAIRVIKGLFADQPLHFSGAHYRIDGLESYPVPGHLSLLIGGGKRRVLELAGREADSVGILTSSVASGSLVADPLERMPEAVAEKVDWVRSGAGARFDQIELSLIPWIMITDDKQGMTEAYIQRQGWHGVCAETVLAMPSVFVGTIGEIAATMERRRAEYGFSYYVVSDAQLEVCAPLVELLS